MKAGTDRAVPHAGSAHEAAERVLRGLRHARAHRMRQAATAALYPFPLGRRRHDREARGHDALRRKAAEARVEWAMAHLRMIEAAGVADPETDVIARLPRQLAAALEVVLRFGPDWLMHGIYVGVVLGCADSHPGWQLSQLESRLRRLAVAYVACHVVPCVKGEDLHRLAETGGIRIGSWTAAWARPVGRTGPRRWWRAFLWRRLPDERLVICRDGWIVRDGKAIGAGESAQAALAALRAMRRDGAQALL